MVCHSLRWVINHSDEEDKGLIGRRAESDLPPPQVRKL
jgi:hypothetical protein